MWARGLPPRPARSSYAATDGLLLAVEVVSEGSEIVDRVIKKAEYARAGIPRYWVIERDSVTTVHRHTLDRATSEYEPEPAGHRTGDPDEPRALVDAGWSTVRSGGDIDQALALFRRAAGFEGEFGRDAQVSIAVQLYVLHRDQEADEVQRVSARNWTISPVVSAPCESSTT